MKIYMDEHGKIIMPEEVRRTFCCDKGCFFECHLAQNQIILNAKHMQSQGYIKKKHR